MYNPLLFSARHFSVFLLSVTFLFSPFLSCKNQHAEPDLPPETQAGANTFGCRINGRVWVPQAKKPSDNNNLILLEVEPVRQGCDGLFYVTMLEPTITKETGGVFHFFPTLSTEPEPTSSRGWITGA